MGELGVLNKFFFFFFCMCGIIFIIKGQGKSYQLYTKSSKMCEVPRIRDGSDL